MSNYLLAADLHLTDNPLDEYRWKIFDQLAYHALQNKVKEIFLLGDVWDRKDRHSGKLVNRVVDSLSQLNSNACCPISIIRGNHDSALEGKHYWEFLNGYNGYSYITDPVYYHDPGILLLPFSSNPIKEWTEGFVANAFKAPTLKSIFMHQPVEGAFIDEYRKLEKAPVLPPLPDVAVFSGDIHRPQILGSIHYIGTPFPVHFNETWPNRIILIKDGNFTRPQDIWLDTPKRAILEITETEELLSTEYKSGDQLRIRVKLDGKNLISWSEREGKIREWADSRGIFIASIEAKLEGDTIKEETQRDLDIPNPKQVLLQYGKQEKLSDEILNIGISLLESV